MASGGGEAIDIAIKAARFARQRARSSRVIKAYHGTPGSRCAPANPRFSQLSSATVPTNSRRCRSNDLNAMEDALRKRDVAAVLMETIPATYGFPMPKEGYLKGVKRLCEKYDALYIADEVQTGLMRTGEMWGVYKYGVIPTCW